MSSTAMPPPFRAIVFAALVVCVTASSAHSQAAQVKRIDVTEYGIYTADITKKQPGQVGVAHNTVANIRHAVTTRTVPAQLGVHFGFRYRIVGAPNAAPITVTKITIFPPAGLNKPGVAKPIKRSEYTLSRKIGDVSYTDYSFEQPWEVVPCAWTFELWVGNRKLASQTFNVAKQ